MEKVLVTGGAGAIGSHLSNELLKRRYQVVVIDNLLSGSAELLDENVILIEGTICNETDLNKAFSYKPDYVFHLASFFANQNSVEHPSDDLDTNGHGMLNVLKFSTEFKSRKVLYASSSCVYENVERMSEDCQSMSYATPYAISKFLGENYCRYWSNYFKLDTVIVRLFNSYGPGEYPGKYRNVIPNFLHKAMSNMPLPITGTGSELRDFNFVDDTTQGIMKAMFSPTDPGDLFNIASGKETSIMDLALMINEITENAAGTELHPSRTWDSVNRRVGIIDKATRTLGYHPQTSLRDGLRRTYEWFQRLYQSA